MLLKRLRSLISNLNTWFQNYKEKRRFSKLSYELREQASTRSLPELVELIVDANSPFRASQLPDEILTLLHLLQEQRPRYLCEIGTYKGGTLFLFCQVAVSDAQLFSIDIKFPELKKDAFRLFARASQRVNLLEGNSNDPNTRESLEQLLQGKKLDFLLIDGDHSYEGVNLDFELFSPLVRKGGIIAFHDIHPDYSMTKGIATRSYVGGVPKFWNMIKEQHSTKEIIAQEDQDGFGIGIIYW